MNSYSYDHGKYRTRPALSVTLPADLAQAIKAAAHAEGLTISRVVEAMLLRAVRYERLEAAQITPPLAMLEAAHDLVRKGEL